MARRWLLAFALVLLLAAPAGAERRASSGTVEVTALAVAETESGFVGSAATVEATVLGGGSGQVFVATKPLAATDMQGSARLASRVAAATLGFSWTAYDYLVTFRSDSTVIGGPSAGAVMTLALTTALHNLANPGSPWSLDPTVAGTGTINPDGTIGPVGGIPAKAEAAAAAGITTFLYPAGLDQATTLVAGAFGPQQVVVDMQDHCAALRITCRPVATVQELIEAAAGVRLERPAVPTPETRDYADVLAPAVRPGVNRLAARVAALESDGRPASFTAAERERRAEELGTARGRLEEARSALDAGEYYLAATRTFQGAISAGRAENLTGFYAADRDEAMVLSALSGCEEAVAAAQDVTDGLVPGDLQELYAVAAAQERTLEAANLLAEATATHQSAVRFEDWIQSMFTATFCVERARSAEWWAGLRDGFGEGPTGDLDLLEDDLLDQARDLVAYADAVLEGGATEAQERLAAAESESDAGRAPAAILLAIEAQTQASVALQTGGGAEVPDAVLAAAQDAASRAVADARSRGLEPLLSVSLVELSQSQSDSALALENLWTARSAALLGAIEGEPDVVDGRSVTDGNEFPIQAGWLAAAASAGLLLGAGLVAAAWSLSRR